MRVARSLYIWARKILIMPVGRIWWANAVDARAAGRWDVVARRVEAIHRWHWENNNSRFLPGGSVRQLDRHEDAIDQIERIDGALTPPLREQERLLQTAHSLNHVGRIREALEVLPSYESLSEVFPDYVEEARELYQNLIDRADWNRELYAAGGAQGLPSAAAAARRGRAIDELTDLQESAADSLLAGSPPRPADAVFDALRSCF